MGPTKETDREPTEAEDWAAIPPPPKILEYLIPDEIDEAMAARNPNIED